MTTTDYAADTTSAPRTNWEKLYREAHEGRIKPPSPARRVGHTLRADMTPGQARAAAEPIKRRTEDGFAVDFVTYCGGRAAYLVEHASWLAWDGHTWVKDRNASLVSELAREYVREVYEANAYLPSADQMNVGVLRRLTANAGIQSLLALAQRDPRAAAHVHQFDAEREELNTPGGVVDMRTGVLSEPDPRRLVMRATTVAPDWSCPTPLFDRFMAETFAGQPELADYALDMLGVSLLGGQDTQTFVLNYGEPASGKSTLMKLVQLMLGMGDSGYSITCDHRMFEKSKDDRHSTEIAKLAGARMVVTSEIAQGKQLDHDKFKMLVSGDRLTARFMRQDEFEYDPLFTLWVMSNHRAKAPASEAAFWRRIKVLRYPHSVAESDRIDHLEQTIYDQEGPGVLAKMIDRTRAFLDPDGGLRVPRAVLEETKSHRAENNSFGAWVDDELHESADGFESTADLFRSYLAWCKVFGVPTMERAAFRKELVEAGYQPKDTSSARGFRGVRVGPPIRSSF